MEIIDVSEIDGLGPVKLPVAASAKAPSMLYLVGALAGGNLVANLLRMVGGLLQARCVAPTVLGLFNGIGLVMGYVPFLQLGILNGINRELPYFIGKGDRQRVNELAAAAQAWALLVGGVVCVGMLGVAAWQLLCGDVPLAAGWCAYAIFAVLFFYNPSYLQMTYRTSHDFARLALAGVAENAVALVLVALVALFGFYGLCLRLLLSALVSVTILFLWRPVRVGPAWNLQHLKHLLIIGAPIFGVGQLSSLWIVLNSTLVLQYVGTEGLGLYAVVLMAGSTLDLLPNAVSQVIYPRMAEQFGRTGRLNDLVRMSIKPTILTAVGMTALLAAGYWFIEPVVRILLPAYVKAVPAVQWAILVPLLNSFACVMNVFNVVRRQDLYAVALLLGVASYFGSLMWLIQNGVSLVAFPQAMLIGRTVSIVACYVFVAFLLHRANPRREAT